MSTLEANSETTSPLPAVTSGKSIVATDGELLLRFTRHGDEAAFAKLVEAHGPLVWSVCRQVLHRQADMEDAFQATFMILARRAGDIRASDSAAGWLYRVAHRTSVALARRNKSRPEEPLNGHDFAAEGDDPLELVHRQHSITVLVEELRTLPKRYQEPLVLCYLEGHTRSRVAEMLDQTTATIKGRLARGKRMLRHRLARRGVALSVAAGMAAASVETAKSSTMGGALVASTTAAATSFTASTTASTTATGGSATAGASPTACSLASQGVSAMFYTALAKPALSVVAIVAMGLMAAVANDDSPQPAALPSSGVSLVASMDGGDVADVDATTVDVQVDATPSDSPRQKPKVLVPSTLHTASPKPAAPAAGSKHETVVVEVATLDGSDEDILVLKGEQAAVARVRGKMIEMFNQPPTPPAPPLAATESRSIRVHTTDGDHDIYVPDINVTAPAQPNFVWYQEGDEQPSVEEMELELKYWETRAQGLDLKADGIEQQIERLQQLKETGSVSADELTAATERVGDMTLLRADAYRAQAKVLEMKRKIELRKKQASVPQPALPPRPSFVPAPANYTQPAESPHRFRVYTPSATTPTLPAPQLRYAPQPAIAPPSPDKPQSGYYDPGTAEVLWFTDIDEARKLSRLSNCTMLVQFTSPQSGPCVKFNQMVEGSPAIRKYISQNTVPVKINVNEQPEVTEEFKITRVPTVCVVHPGGEVLRKFTAPANEMAYIRMLHSVIGDIPSQSGNDAPSSQVPLPTPASHPPVGNKLLPHENVRVTITQQRPREGKWVVTAALDSAGNIPLKDFGFADADLGQVHIGGNDTNQAANEVLGVISQHYGEFFKSMGFDVKVERNRDIGEAEAAEDVAEPESSLPPPSNAKVAVGRYSTSDPRIVAPSWDARYNSDTNGSELAKLKKEIEALRKENKELKNQSQDVPSLDPPGPPELRE